MPKTAESTVAATAAALLSGVKINTGQKAQAFLSSRMSYELEGEPLSDIRKELKGLLEAAYPFLAVELAEDWSAGQHGSPKELSRKGGARSDLFLVILVDSAGHLDDAGLYATEAEVNGAVQDSWDKVLVFVHNDLFASLETQSQSYRRLVEELIDYEKGKNVTAFGNREELFAAVFAAVASHSATALRRLSARISGKSDRRVEWELMTFTERFNELHETFEKEAATFEGVPALKKLELEKKHDGHVLYRATFDVDGPKQVPVIVSACPDRFSFPEAARFVGYPFRTMIETWEQTVSEWKEKRGPLHIVMIYRNITDTQIRRHLGNPDIRVAREPWGFFARDPERFIQSLFLVNCQDPIAVHERLHEAIGWLADGRLEVTLDRALGRGLILQARRRSRD